MSTKAQEFDQYYLEALTFEPTAMAALVQCYLQGHGTEVDMLRAQEWIEKLNLSRRSFSHIDMVENFRQYDRHHGINKSF